MKVKLLKSVIVNSVSNTQPTARDSVVEVDDAEGKEMVQAGIAEETTAKVTAEARQAPAADNKMAPDAENKDDGTAARGANPTRAAGTAKR